MTLCKPGLVIACNANMASRCLLLEVAFVARLILKSYACREHEDMSEKLLDLAVEEACEVYNLAEDHFLRNTANIAAAKNMIAGGGTDISPEKAWLYSIVCNKRSGAFSAACVQHSYCGEDKNLLREAHELLKRSLRQLFDE